MPEIPRTKFNSPWTVANIEAALNDVSSAKGSSESLTAALNAMRAEINSLSGGVHLKGAVDYYADLPASPSEGDAYTVRYQGTSGTDPLGIEYAWATYQGTPQWIPIGVDPSVFAKQTEMDVVANAGAKNLLNVLDAGAFPKTVNGVTYNESNGIITTSDSATITTTLKMPITLTAGTYIITGCPSGGSDTKYRIDMRLQGTATVVGSNDYGSGFTFTVDTTTDYDCCIRFYQGASAAGLTFKPMIRPAAITDPTFQPYAKTNRELTVLTDEDRVALVEIVDGGAKNKLQNTAISDTVNGVTFTVNSDFTVSVSGAVDSSHDNAIFNINTYAAETGDVLCSGLGSGNANAYVYARGGSVSTTNNDGNQIPAGDIGVSRIYAIAILKSAGAVNLTFKPMICAKSAWDISHAYQPYRPSWQEMWDAIQALQSGGNRALTMQTEPEEQEER